MAAPQRSQEGAAAGEARLGAVFENAPDAMLIVDDERRYVDANPAACEMFGITREEFLRRSVGDLSPPSGRPQLDEYWRALMAAGKLRGEYRYELPDGALRELQFSVIANFMPGRHLAIVREVGGAGVAGAGLRLEQPAVEEEATAAEPEAGRRPARSAWEAGRKAGEREEALSAREQEIVDLLAEGLTTEEIASRLVISSATVRTHVRNARQKLGAHTRAQAVAKALRQGEIEL